MTFGAAIKKAFQNLTNFKGRARRSEFWWFYLFMFLVNIPVTIIIMIPTLAALANLEAHIDPVTGQVTEGTLMTYLGPVLLTYGLLFLVSAIIFFLLLAVWVRRLHDGGYSGHFMWLGVIGLGIVPLIMAIMDGQRYENRFGPDPKALEYQVWPGREAGPVYAEPTASPTLTPPPYMPPAAPVAPQATQPLPPADPASDPFMAPPN